jgi:hypothetical protein
MMRNLFAFDVKLTLVEPQPGYPDGNTRDGYGAMMEVAYVAQYTT